jgi:hypothetical protein
MQLPGGGGHSRYLEVEGTMLQAIRALWQAMRKVRATGRVLVEALFVRVSRSEPQVKNGLQRERGVIGRRRGQAVDARRRSSGWAARCGQACDTGSGGVGDGRFRRDAMRKQQKEEKRRRKRRRTVGSRSNYSDGPNVSIARASGALWTVWRRPGLPSGGVAWAATARMPETSLTLLSSSDGDANGHRRLSAGRLFITDGEFRCDWAN